MYKVLASQLSTTSLEKTALFQLFNQIKSDFFDRVVQSSPENHVGCGKENLVSSAKKLVETYSVSTLDSEDAGRPAVHLQKFMEATICEAIESGKVYRMVARGHTKFNLTPLSRPSGIQDFSSYPKAFQSPATVLNRIDILQKLAKQKGSEIQVCYIKERCDNDGQLIKKEMVTYLENIMKHKSIKDLPQGFIPRHWFWPLFPDAETAGEKWEQSNQVWEGLRIKGIIDDNGKILKPIVNENEKVKSLILNAGNLRTGSTDTERLSGDLSGMTYFLTSNEKPEQNYCLVFMIHAPQSLQAKPGVASFELHLGIFNQEHLRGLFQPLDYAMVGNIPKLLQIQNEIFDILTQ